MQAKKFKEIQKIKKILAFNLKIYERCFKIRYEIFKNSLELFDFYSIIIKKEKKNLINIEFDAEKELKEFIAYISDNEIELFEIFENYQKYQIIDFFELNYAIIFMQNRRMKDRDKELEFSYNNFCDIINLIIECLRLNNINEKFDSMMIEK